MKLVGFSGKLGHGKDMAAEMFQYIQYKESSSHFYVPRFEDWENLTDDERRMLSGTQIEKFGGKLKDIICVLLNCTREQLEDREFKETPLSENWWYYSFQSWTDKGRIISKKDWNSLKDNQKEYYDLVKTTPRLLLQLMGTECGREILHPDVWVNATLDPYLEQLRWIRNDSDNKNKFNDWVISDVRFPNEVESMEELDGIVIRIERDSVVPSENEHESETALDDYKFKYVLKNNGTKEELLEKIYKIYKNKFK